MNDRHWMTTTAGVLDILAAVGALCGAFFLAFGFAMVCWAAEREGGDFPLVPMRVLFGGLALFLIVAFLVALCGGIAALRAGSWGWALAGAIAAVLTCTPLGLPALILTVMAEDRFRHVGTG